MRPQNIKIICSYAKDGPDLKDMIIAVFQSFLKRELETYGKKAQS